MKKPLIAAFVALVIGVAGTAQAQLPCGTMYGNWSNSTGNYVPYGSYNYGTTPLYGAYSTYPRYGSTWNASNYRAPGYTYDPVHRDYHVNSSPSFNHWNNGFGNSFPQYRNW